MKIYLALMLAIGLGSFASGCASLSQNRCLEADWEQIGEDDGDIGRSADTIKNHQEACEPHGITPDTEAWRSGYEAGLEDYCSLRGGIETGRNGRTYTRVCDAEFEPEFLRGYNTGRQIFRAEAKVREINAQLKQYYYELQYNGSLSSDLRRRYQTEAIRLEQRLTRARNDIEYSQQRAQALLRDLE